MAKVTNDIIMMKLEQHINTEESFWTHVKGELSEIKKHAEYTNGKVADTIKELAEQKTTVTAWREQMNGWVRGLGVSMPVIMALIVYIWINHK